MSTTAAKSQFGIQQLLQAEQRAQQIVDSARKEKVSKLRAAREEAEAEIAAYRSQREAQYQKYRTEHLSNTTAYVDALEGTTGTQIMRINTDVSENEHKVIKLLLDCVTDVKIEMDYDLAKAEAKSSQHN